MLRRGFVFKLSCGIVFVILYFAIINGRFKQPGVSFSQRLSLENKDERLKSQKDKLVVNTVLNSFRDYNCLTTLNGIINQDGDVKFVIPTNDVLLTLPENVLDCLYQRYTTTLQTYCAKRSRHGSVLDGWTLCIDGCYKPTTNTIVHVLSSKNEYRNDHSLENVHHSKVHRFFPKWGIDMSKKLVFIRRKIGQVVDWKHFKEVNLTYAVHKSMDNEDILIMDVDRFTTQTVNHVIESGILNHVQQLLIRTDYSNSIRSNIYYITALNQLRQLYDYGFRIYWSRMEFKCVLQHNRNRTSCVYIHMVYKECRNIVESSIGHGHLVIPDDSTIQRMNQNGHMDLYHRYLTSTQIYCKEVVRLGGVTDGGWDVCNDSKYKPQQPCLVYSFGIKWDFSFDDAIAETYGCEVHSFDPSMNTTDFQRSKHIWFHDVGLLDKKDFFYKKRNWTLSTLTDIREDLGHTARKINILKIDIERSEWAALPDMIRSGSIRDVTQLYIEFHSHGTPRHLQILRLLYNEGFRIFWYHRNPECVLNKQLFQYAWCNEVYFLRQ